MAIDDVEEEPVARVFPWNGVEETLYLRLLEIDNVARGGALDEVHSWFSSLAGSHLHAFTHFRELKGLVGCPLIEGTSPKSCPKSSKASSSHSEDARAVSLLAAWLLALFLPAAAARAADNVPGETALRSQPGLPGTIAATHGVRRRAIGARAAQWFWDRDGDGWGSRELASAAHGNRVTNCLDCDDLHTSVFVTMVDMVPDCNGNHIADDSILTVVCVGHARTGPIIDLPDGTFVANLIFVDKNGTLWIPSEWAKRDADGQLVVDFGYGGCPRM